MDVLIKRLQEKGALLERGLVCRQPLSLEREDFISYATNVYRFSNDEDLQVLCWYFEVMAQIAGCYGRHMTCSQKIFSGLLVESGLVCAALVSLYRRSLPSPGF